MNFTKEISQCKHDRRMSSLVYYYDDDWGSRGTKVWYNSNHREYRGELCVCLDCGLVFVQPREEDINESDSIEPIK